MQIVGEYNVYLNELFGFIRMEHPLDDYEAQP